MKHCLQILFAYVTLRLLWWRAAALRHTHSQCSRRGSLYPSHTFEKKGFQQNWRFLWFGRETQSFPSATLIDKGPSIWIKQIFARQGSQKCCFIHISGPLSITVEAGRISNNKFESWALVKNVHPHLSLSLSLVSFPCLSIVYAHYGKTWGRDLERNRWGWPHSLQAPVV